MVMEYSESWLIIQETHSRLIIQEMQLIQLFPYKIYSLSRKHDLFACHVLIFPDKTESYDITSLYIITSSPWAKIMGFEELVVAKLTAWDIQGCKKVVEFSRMINISKSPTEIIPLSVRLYIWILTLSNFGEIY